MAARPVHILVIEDETIIAMKLHHMLSSTDYHVVGPFTRLNQANAALDTEHVDFAVLDIRLGETDVFPLAATLSERKIPFMFVTGYGKQTIPQAFADRPCLSKPFRDSEFLVLIADLMKSHKLPNRTAIN
jgi:DNA-binding NtrC family response regulator